MVSHRGRRKTILAPRARRSGSITPDGRECDTHRARDRKLWGPVSSDVLGVTAVDGRCKISCSMLHEVGAQKSEHLRDVIYPWSLLRLATPLVDLISTPSDCHTFTAAASMHGPSNIRFLPPPLARRVAVGATRMGDHKSRMAAAFAAASLRWHRLISERERWGNRVSVVLSERAKLQGPPKTQ